MTQKDMNTVTPNNKFGALNGEVEAVKEGMQQDKNEQNKIASTNEWVTTKFTLGEKVEKCKNIQGGTEQDDPNKAKLKEIEGSCNSMEISQGTNR